MTRESSPGRKRTTGDLIASELSVIGSMLRHNPVIDDVAMVVREDDFYDSAYRKYFAAILAIHGRAAPVDLVTLAEELKSRGQIEDVGGYSKIAELWDVCPTGAHAERYAKIVHDESVFRKVTHVCNYLLLLAESRTGSADDLVAEAETKVLGVSDYAVAGQATEIRDVLIETCLRIDARSDRADKMCGLSTGHRDLDEKLAGLQDGELITIAARPGIGKTSFAVGIARFASLVEQVPSVIFSLEMAKAELGERLICSEAGLDSQRVRRNMCNPIESARMAEAVQKLNTAQLLIDDTPTQTMTRIAAQSRRLKNRKGIRLIVIDYLQLIEAEDRRVPRHEQVSAITRRMKILARELKIPVVMLAQLNRQVEARAGGKPMLSDLRESGSIEQDSDVVLLMSQRPDSWIVDVDIAKQRNGPTGDVPLIFRRESTRFEDYIGGVA